MQLINSQSLKQKTTKNKIVKTPTEMHRKARQFFSKLGSLLLLFQRTPIVQMILPEARVLGTSGMGELAKWSVASVVGLCAFDSIAGASTITQLQPTPGSLTVNATQNKSLAFVFQVTGVDSRPGSWQIIGALPNGLNHNNAAFNSVDSISGIPTQAGSFPITVKAWEFSGFAGPSTSKAFTIVVGNGGIAPLPTITKQPASFTIKTGNFVTLSVTASGTGLTYQWYKGASGITTRPILTASAKTAAYKTPILTTTSKYWVQVKNAGGTVNSNTVTVKVTP